MNRSGLIRVKYLIVFVMILSFCGYYGCDNPSGSRGCDAGSSSSSSSSSSGGGTDPVSNTVTMEENSAGFCYVDGTIESNYEGYSGSGFANTTNSEGKSIEWAVNTSSGGIYTLQWRYANGASARSARVVINGQTAANVQFDGTGAWDSWADSAAIQVTLASGGNLILLQSTNVAGLANIDAMTVSGANISAGSCGADNLPEITIWIAGDSTVASGSSGSCPVGWGRSFATYFNGKVTVDNRAVGGRSVRTWLYDVQSTMDASGECVLTTDYSGTPIVQDRWQFMLDNMKPGDYLLIQFGINDGSPTCPRHVGSSAFKASYGMMANAAKQRGAYPVFITPVSAIACSGYTAVGTRGFLTETAAAGQTYNVPVIDLHAMSVDLYNTKNFCPVPGGDVSATTTGAVGRFFCDDHTHFEASGALEIGGLVAEGLRANGIALADYLK